MSRRAINVNSVVSLLSAMIGRAVQLPVTVGVAPLSRLLTRLRQRAFIPAAGCARRRCAGASTDRPACVRWRRRARATCSGVRFQPTAPRLSRSCSSLRAPMMTVDDRGPLQQPVERNLRHRLAGLLRHRVERVDHAEHVLVGDRRAHRSPVSCSRLVCRQRLAAADLAGQAAPAERAPHHRARRPGRGQRHQLPLVVAADQRVVRLVGDVARPAVAVGDRERSSSGASRRSSSTPT